MPKPFEKPVKRRDNSDNGNWPGGRDNGSFQYGTEYVNPYNGNTADKSPTTSSRTCEDVNKNQFFPRPKYKTPIKFP